eukprot:2481082-Pleurochrysis_carterae.AAC.1
MRPACRAKAPSIRSKQKSVPILKRRKRTRTVQNGADKPRPNGAEQKAQATRRKHRDRVG